MTKKELDHRQYLKIKDTPEYKIRNARGSGKWKKTHRAKATEANRVWARNYHADLKLEVLSHYGLEGKLQCCWPECCVIDVDMLSLDHVNNDGAQERRNGNRGGAGHPMYARVKRNGFPEEFQTLCHNHQWKKELMRRREQNA
jgi:hypothetical protein